MKNQNRISVKSRNLEFIGTLCAIGVLNVYSILFDFAFVRANRTTDIRFFLVVVVVLYVAKRPPPPPHGHFCTLGRIFILYVFFEQRFVHPKQRIFSL